MKCSDIHNLLTGHLLGDLDPAVSKDVEAHLVDCGDCQASMRELELTLDLVQDALVATRGAPTRLQADRLEKVLKARYRPVIEWVTTYHPQFTKAAAILIIGLFLLCLITPATQKAREMASTVKMGESFGDADGKDFGGAPDSGVESLSVTVLPEARYSGKSASRSWYEGGSASDIGTGTEHDGRRLVQEQAQINADIGRKEAELDMILRQELAAGKLRPELTRKREQIQEDLENLNGTMNEYYFEDPGDRVEKDHETPADWSKADGTAAVALKGLSEQSYDDPEIDDTDGDGMALRWEESGAGTFDGYTRGETTPEPGGGNINDLRKQLAMGDSTVVVPLPPPAKPARTPDGGAFNWETAPGEPVATGRPVPDPEPAPVAPRAPEPTQHANFYTVSGASVSDIQPDVDFTYRVHGGNVDEVVVLDEVSIAEATKLPGNDKVQVTDHYWPSGIPASEARVGGVAAKTEKKPSIHAAELARQPASGEDGIGWSDMSVVLAFGEDDDRPVAGHGGGGGWPKGSTLRLTEANEPAPTPEESELMWASETRKNKKAGKGGIPILGKLFSHRGAATASGPVPLDAPVVREEPVDVAGHDYYGTYRRDENGREPDSAVKKDISKNSDREFAKARNTRDRLSKEHLERWDRDASEEGDERDPGEKSLASETTREKHKADSVILGATNLGGDQIVADDIVEDEKTNAESERSRRKRELETKGLGKRREAEELQAQREAAAGRRLAKEKREKEEEAARKELVQFKAHGLNPFVLTADNAFSTFAIDVDTAAYTLARNYMMRGLLPPPESVRTEEFVNFFDYEYPAPEQHVFDVYTECAPTPFGRGLHTLKIGVKGKRIGRDQQRNAVLTFVIDTSGSMNTPDRLGLVRKSLSMLIDKLGPADKIAIVQYDSRARMILDYTTAAEKQKIMAALDGMQTSGSTNLEEGLREGYRVAAAGFAPGSMNRVLLLSDGVANLGTDSADAMLDNVEEYRDQGIYCSVFGFGIGKYNDEILESLADKGDGTYSFIDSEEEARRVFVDELGATLNVIAKDAKIQVEFNPKLVRQYRQLGYENRQLTKQQFRDNTVDAGEVGSGQSVTALYEIDLGQEALRKARRNNEHLATVRVRYEDPDTGEVSEMERCFYPSEMIRRFDLAPDRFKLATCVAEFAEILRGSDFARGSTFEDVATELRPVAQNLHLDSRVAELLALVSGAGSMARGN